MNQPKTENNISVEFNAVGSEFGDEVFEFLNPFMQQNLLLSRDRIEIGKLMERGFAAFHDGRIVGFAAVEIYSKKLAELQCLAVDPNYRRMRIGKTLIEMCCEAAKKADVAELLAISASDEMFKACGFDYSLPNQKRALFYHPRSPSPES